jgi:hypothetical protein
VAGWDVSLMTTGGATFSVDTESGDADILAHGASTLGNSDVGGDFVFENTSGDLFFDGTTTAGGGFTIAADNGNMYGVSSGPHVVAGSESFLGTPNGTMGLGGPDGLFHPIDVNVNARLWLDIGAVGPDFTCGLLSGFVNDPAPLNGKPIVPAPSLTTMEYPTPLYPPGKIWFTSPKDGTTLIWPPSQGVFSTRSMTDGFRFLFPHAERLAQGSVNVMDPASSAAFRTGPVFFYHPLSEVDNGAYDGFNLEEGAYEFIDGQLNACADDGKGGKVCKKSSAS